MYSVDIGNKGQLHFYVVIFENCVQSNGLSTLCGTSALCLERDSDCAEIRAFGFT